MAPTTRIAAISHVGKIRSNNQDSAYAGKHLFVVADGMGGHAGGDVASAIAVKRIAEADRSFPSINDAEFALRSAVLAANSILAETVFDHSELTGMGTTVSGIIRVDDHVAIAHIGDSRIYLYREGVLQQVSSDHTFVQRLVDSGRITIEEAAVHPRRAVLMRVLGDVDAAPDIDTTIMDTLPGDRWLLCSDGLSSFVAEEKIKGALTTLKVAQDAAERLIKEALDQGAPDNVTVVVVDIDEENDPGQDPPLIVGSAAEPLVFAGDTARRSLRLPTLLLHPLKASKPDDSHFEPESEEYLDELIFEDRMRRRRRRIGWLVLFGLAIAAVAAAIVLGYQWTQSHYFVGAEDGKVVIFQGVQQDIGSIALSTVYERTTVELSELPAHARSRVEETISATDLGDAHRIVDQLANDSNR